MQRSLYVLDEAVVAYRGDERIVLEAGTVISVTAGGSIRGRQAWRGRLADGREIDICVE